MGPKTTSQNRPRPTAPDQGLATLGRPIMQFHQFRSCLGATSPSPALVARLLRHTDPEAVHARHADFRNVAADPTSN